MTEFLLILLTFSQIPIVFVFLSHLAGGLMAFSPLRKNREWVIAHPEINRHRSYTRLWLGFSYLLAAISFMAALKFTLITPISDPAVLIRFLLVIPFMIWWVSFMVYWSFIYFGVFRKIPAPTKRRAPLATRKLSKYVPLWVVCLGYAFLALIITAYSLGWASGEVSGETAIPMLFGFGFSLVGVTFSLLVVTRFKYTEEERACGSDVRVAGVLIVIGALYFNVLAGFYRILSDFFGITLFLKFGFVAAIWLVVQLAAVGVLVHPKIRSLRQQYRQTYLPGRS